MEDPTGLIDVVVFEDALNRYGDVIVKNRAYLIEGVLQNNTERGIALVAERIAPYVVRDDHNERVRLRRGIGVGPLGPTRPGAGAPEGGEDDASLREADAEIPA
jgi:hypothetical protein